MKRLLPLIALILAGLACGGGIPSVPPTHLPPTRVVPTQPPTPLPVSPVSGGDPNEPVFISGDIPYTSPFFVEFLSEALVLLEDQAGFVARDFEFTFDLEGQVIGPVELQEDGSLRYSLALPAVPQGTFVDVDNDGDADPGVQVFAVAFWGNTWGGPFLEERDAGGWSTGSVSTISNAERDGEIEGGILIVWSPDEAQSFPTGFGADAMLFTADDPVAPIAAGYNLVSLDAEPFQFWKEPRPEITLHEGSTAVNDYSDMEYTEAFEALFAKVAREYPFTADKDIDWDALYAEFSPQIADARNDAQFYRAMRGFALSIPDAHVGLSFDAQVFYDDAGGSFGMRLAELSDGRIVVVEVFPDFAAEGAGIAIGAEIKEWDGQPVGDALDEVLSLFGPYSTAHHERLGKLIFLTRYPPGTRVDVSFQNPGEASPQEANLEAEVDYDSLFASIPAFQLDELALPIEGEILDNGLGYIRINSFLDDLRLEAYLWERLMDQMLEFGVEGLIIDVRVNGGGSGGLAADFAGYFFQEEIEISRGLYYNDVTGVFEYSPGVSRIRPAPVYFDGAVALLVSPDCVSACEGFANMMSQQGRAAIIGHFPTAGAFGEVGQGQYELPGGYTMQVPTGRPETMDGELLIEGVGIPLDVTVPITLESALGQVDAVLKAAISFLLGTND